MISVMAKTTASWDDRRSHRCTSVNRPVVYAERALVGLLVFRIAAALLFLSVAATAECVVYSAACKLGADWYRYHD